MEKGRKRGKRSLNLAVPRLQWYLEPAGAWWSRSSCYRDESHSLKHIILTDFRILGKFVFLLGRQSSILLPQALLCGHTITTHQNNSLQFDSDRDGQSAILLPKALSCTQPTNTPRQHLFTF